MFNGTFGQLGQPPQQGEAQDNQQNTNQEQGVIPNGKLPFQPLGKLLFPGVFGQNAQKRPPLRPFIRR